MKTDIQIEVRSDPMLLKAVRTMITAYMTRFGFNEERCLEFALAVDEACTNAMRHAYGGATDRRLHLTMGSEEDWVQIELRDEGCPASAEKVQKKAVVITPTKEDITPGGLGVQLIYEVFDEVQFTPGVGIGNCVTMRARRPDTSNEEPE